MSTLPGTKGYFLKNNIILLGLIVILCLLNGYHRTVFFRPGSYHQWRQTDCLSIAKNYYEQGMHFFEPRIHYQGVEGGKAVSECPILNYSAATLWKVFGEHEFIYRLLEYLIYVTAIFVFFNTLLRFFKSAGLAFFAAGFILTSPLLVYYGLNFIADVPAFSLGVIGLCFFYNFYVSARQRFYYWALVIGTLAVLMKASALMGLGILLFFTLIDVLRLNQTFKTRLLFNNRVWPVVAVVVAMATIFCWYLFALQYNDNNNNNIFLLTVLPIWEMNQEELFRNLKMLFNNLFPLFLNRPMFFLFALLTVYVTANFKKLDTFFKVAFVFSAMYFVFYLLFFFQVFGVHDYYLVNLMIFPVTILMSTVSLLVTTNFVAVNSAFIRLAGISLLVFNAFHAAAIYRMRTMEYEKMATWFPFISEDEKKLADYLFWDYGNSIKKIENITPHLRAAGIKREDFVLSIPDYSFDVSLYMMDQKGYTIARDHIQHDSTVVDRFVPKVTYVIFSDTNLMHERAFQRVAHYFAPFMKKGPVQVLKKKPNT